MATKNITIPLESEGIMTTLSRLEIEALLGVSRTAVYETFRRCCLAVLTSGNDETHNVPQTLKTYEDFSVSLHPRNGGIELDLVNPPHNAFVDGAIIEGIRENLYAVLRDVLFVENEIFGDPRFDFGNTEHVTAAVFQILRNANVLRPRTCSRLVVCWGGHSIARREYEYTKQVGYQLGLRGLDICTGCGPGAMKGPMKGAAIGHSKQRNKQGRYVGISEPGIIAAESPNPIVNQLVIMPDIEKRLEAFLRLGHAFVVFPGGVGTAEEVLYVLGILLHPKNAARQIPLFLTGAKETEHYFHSLDRFIGATLGAQAQSKYRIVIGDPEAVARAVYAAVREADAKRLESNDATFFNWRAHIDGQLQRPFEPTHANVRALDLRLAQPTHELAAALRCVFSAIVAGNIKDAGIREVAAHGPLSITGPSEIIEPLERLLAEFVEAGRMTVQASYEAPYRLTVAA